MRIKLYILLLFLSSIFLFSCGKKDDRNEIKTVNLSQFDSSGKTYELKIASAFIRSLTGPDIRLNAVYPGMKDPNYRYVHRVNDKRKDRVRLTLSIPNISAGRLYNDLGRDGMKEEIVVRSSGYVQVPTPKNIEEESKVDKYMGTGDKGQMGIYVISQDDNRISRIRCTFDTVCTGRTMWNEKILIRYDFPTEIFNKLVDLDRSVVSLIDSFMPRLIKNKEKKSQ